MTMIYKKRKNNFINKWGKKYGKHKDKRHIYYYMGL